MVVKETYYQWTEIPLILLGERPKEKDRDDTAKWRNGAAKKRESEDFCTLKNLFL